MSAADRLDAVREMEEPIFEVRDWGEAVHMAAHALPDEEQRAALAQLGHTISRLGEVLRTRWCEAAGMNGRLK